MDRQQEFERAAVWAMFREVAPLTGRLRIDEPYRQWLIDNGYIVFDFQHEFARRDGLDGWKVYRITEAGEAIIREIYRRDVRKKASWGIQDSFTDGLIGS